MLPIFKEYIDFLNHKTNNGGVFLQEGKYWYDKSIIKAFDVDGNIVKVARINVDDELNLTIKPYTKKLPQIETWEDTVIRYSNELKELEKASTDLINNSLKKYDGRDFIVLSSGGKDSTVTNFLVKKCIDNPQVIFNNTSLDCTDTYLYIKKEKNLTIINTNEGFYQ